MCGGSACEFRCAVLDGRREKLPVHSFLLAFSVGKSQLAERCYCCSWVWNSVRLTFYAISLPCFQRNPMHGVAFLVLEPQVVLGPEPEGSKTSAFLLGQAYAMLYVPIVAWSLGLFSGFKKKKTATAAAPYFRYALTCPCCCACN